MFFFEKKNQKTSIRWSPASPTRHALQRMNVVCFLFSKKKRLPHPGSITLSITWITPLD